MAAPAEIGTNGRDVALAERRVLREDDDLLADALAEDLLDRERVLDRLATGAERVAVVARDEIRRGRPRDVQDAVLLGERRDLERDARLVLPPMIL